MPILKHAKKKLRQDKKRTIKNKKLKDVYKSFVKKAKEGKSDKALSKAFSAVDKAAKKNVLSKNKAARLKSSLSKHVTGTTSQTTTAKLAIPARNAAHSAAGGKTAKEKPAEKKEAKVAPKSSKSSGVKKTKPSSKK